MLLLSVSTITKWGVRYNSSKVMEWKFGSKIGNWNLAFRYCDITSFIFTPTLFRLFWPYLEIWTSLYIIIYFITSVWYKFISLFLFHFFIHFLKWVILPLSLLHHHLLFPWLIHFNLPSVFSVLVRLFSLWSLRFPSGKIQWFLFNLPLFFVLSASSGTVGDTI